MTVVYIPEADLELLKSMLTDAIKHRHEQSVASEMQLKTLVDLQETVNGHADLAVDISRLRARRDADLRQLADAVALQEFINKQFEGEAASAPEIVH